MIDAPLSDVAVAKAAVCEEVSDVYTPAGRLALGRAAAGYLVCSLSRPCLRRAPCLWST